MELHNITSKKIMYVFEYFPPYQLGGAEISGKIRMERLAKKNKILMLTPNYKHFRLSVENKGYKLVKFPSLRYFLYNVRKQASHKIIKKDKQIFLTFLLFFNVLSGIEMKFWIWYMERKYGSFDILHGNNIEADIGVSFSKIPAVKVAHLRDTIIFEQIKAGGFQETLHNFLVKFIRNSLVKNIQHFIAISEFMREKCVKHIGMDRRKTTVIFNDVAENQVSNLSVRDTRKLLGLSQEKKYALFVGSLTKEKGVDFLISQVAPQLKGVNFIIVGTGILEDGLKENLPSHVHMVGFIKNEEVKHYYKAANVALVPSVWEEPWGRVSCEAQANGTFTIVNDSGGLPETIQNGAGVVVPNAKLADYLKKHFAM